MDLKLKLAAGACSLIGISAALAGVAFAASDGDDLRHAARIRQLPYAGEPVDTTNFTQEAGELQPQCLRPVLRDVSQSMWYRFDVDEPGSYLIDTRGSTYDTVLTLYDPGRRHVKDFSSLGRVLGCNDDNFLGVTTLQARTIVPLQPGTYYAQIGDYDASPGLAQPHTLSFHIEPFAGGPLP